MDYGFMKAESSEAEGVVGQEFGVNLVVVDSDTGMVRVIPMESKGQTQYAAAGVASFIGSLYVGKMTLRSDGELAILAVANQVRNKLPYQVVLEHAPRYASASNGAAEQKIKQIAEQIRAMRTGMQQKYGKMVTPSDIVWPWLARHAGLLVSRFARGASRQTPFQNAFAREFTE